MFDLYYIEQAIGVGIPGYVSRMFATVIPPDSNHALITEIGIVDELGGRFWRFTCFNEVEKSKYLVQNVLWGTAGGYTLEELNEIAKDYRIRRLMLN